MMLAMNDLDRPDSGAVALPAQRLDVAAPRSAGTARLTLEPLRPAHAPLLFPVLADARLYTYVPDEARASLALLAERFAELERGAPSDAGETWLNWVLLRRDNGAAIGTLQATVEPDGRAWIGYLLTPSSWGQGFATEACIWLVAELARSHGVRDIQASVDARNVKSIALLERLGFARVEAGPSELRGLVTIDYRYLLSVAG